MFSDADVAALYDIQNSWDPAKYRSDAFFHELVMAADAVLDVGCGTGRMLHHARDTGHRGRLVGLDPDVAALDRARRRPDIEWVTAVAVDATWQREFDLATMTSHAFQCLIGDDELRRSLTAIRNALRDAGLFAFETRHPQARAWDEWNRSNASEVVDATGQTLRVWHDVESEIDGVVTLTESVADVAGTVLRVDRGALRFLDVPTLNDFLTEAGFTIDAQYGDGDHNPVTEGSSEIITVARRI